MGMRSGNKLSLLGSVSLGTGVMIGAGIFVLMGQIAELVGNLFPLAFPPLVLVVSLIGCVAILIAQRLFMITHTDSSGVMHMEMGGREEM